MAELYAKKTFANSSNRTSFTTTPPSSKISLDPPKTKPKVISKTLIVGGIALYAFTAYGTYLYIQYRKAIKIQDDRTNPLYQHTTKQEEYTKAFDKISKDYDKLINTGEFFMGMGWLRKKIMKGVKVSLQFLSLKVPFIYWIEVEILDKFMNCD